MVRVVRKPCERDKRWFKARVEDQLDIRTYEARTEDDRVHRRNRRHFRQSKEPFSSTSEPASNQPCIPASTIKQRTPKPTDQSIQNKAQPIRDNPQPATVLSNQGPPPDPKLYCAFSSVTIPFVSQERRGFNSSNFTVILSVCYLENKLKDRLSKTSGWQFRKWVFGSFKKRAPGVVQCQVPQNI